MAQEYLLAIDQGTTSTRAVLFNPGGETVRAAQEELALILPRGGWVEQDPEAIWDATVRAVRSVLAGIDIAGVAGVGIANQRETTACGIAARARPFTMPSSGRTGAATIIAAASPRTATPG